MYLDGTRFVDAAMKFLTDLFKHNETYSFNAKEWKSAINPKGTPFQNIGGDCGVHVCFMADHLSLDMVLKKQSLEGMILY